MKKALLIAALAAGTQLAQAQSIPAGTVSLGGNVGYSRTTNTFGYSVSNVTYKNETTSSQFNFSPSVGYFVADNFAIGINAGYQATRKEYTTKTPAPAIVKAELDPTTTLKLGVYGQYYKMITEQFGVIGTLGGGFQRLRDYEYSGSGSSATILENKASGFYAGLTPSIIFFPIPKLGISASVGSLAYDKLNFDYTETPGSKAPDGYEDKTSTFGANFGLSQLQFGGTYYFGR